MIKDWKVIFLSQPLLDLGLPNLCVTVNNLPITTLPFKFDISLTGYRLTMLLEVTQIVWQVTDIIYTHQNIVYHYTDGRTGSAIGNTFKTLGLKRRPSFVRMVFHLSLRLITFGGRSAHLVDLIHKIGRQTVTAQMTCIIWTLCTF